MDRADIDLDIMEDFCDGNEEFYQKAEQVKHFQIIDRPHSQLVGKRPVSGINIGPSQFFQNF